MSDFSLFPPDEPRDTITLAELAAELDTSSFNLVRHAEELRMPIPENRRLSSDDADRLRTYFVLTSGTVPGDRRGEPLPAFLAEAAVIEHDPVTAAIEDVLGVPQRRRHDRARRARDDHPRRAPRTGKGEPPLTGTAAAAVGQWPDLAPPAARTIAASWSGRYGFTAEQAAAWWRNGLDKHDADLASRLAAAGVAPEHLRLVIRKDTVLYRVRDNMPPWRIADMLRRDGYLDPGKANPA